MKSYNGVYIPEADPSDFPKDKQWGHMSTRSVKQLAEGSTLEQFERMCLSGLSTVDDYGRELRGMDLFEEFKSYVPE